MNKLRRFTVSKLAVTVIRVTLRSKSAAQRPSAPLGSRLLTDPDDVFKHNMWDHVQWTEEDKENAKQMIEENSRVQVSLKEQGKFDTEACHYWDKFYEAHQDKFFKDRRWLFLEFPELLPTGAVRQTTSTCYNPAPASSSDPEAGRHQGSKPAENHRDTDIYSDASCEIATAGQNGAATFPGQQASFRILEVGCGVGNSVFPILKNIKGTDSFLYGCDFSQRAIQLIMDHPDYDDSVCHVFVHDLCEEAASFPFPPRSLDVILAVFVLSSIHPERIQGVVNRLSAYLKDGGVFLFRDYGRYDLSQLRFKKGQCLSENFYTRGDGTCAYFFSKEEVHDLFSKAGLEEVQNLEDKRLQVNRRKKVVMRRVWIHKLHGYKNTTIICDLLLFALVF
uniref:tRNA N(3)-cytidine methyltransferase n=1 Tax=Salarias fasciatus TaxID=181472 RepID=A0A672JCC8_SALFA